MVLRGFVLDEQGEGDLLQEALQSVRDQGFHMQQSIDAGDQTAVLKHAVEMLRELRTSLLSPKNYYQLYMQVVDQLRHLESYVDELQQTGASMRDLYERVQSTGHVVPRLYLLVTVGAVYIKSQEARARDVLMDLVEMAKGVQAPLRGLFLRHYLSLTVRDKLPDTGSVYAQPGGDTVYDAIGFLVENLRATTELWIRLDKIRPASVRAKERHELQLLVGTSLVRLSALDGVTVQIYTSNVLPELLTTIIPSCHDAMAQFYLLDCLIHVFPDEFHLATLDKVLNGMETLELQVDVILIVTALLERLNTFRETQNDGKHRFKLENEGEKVFQHVIETSIKLLFESSRYTMNKEEEKQEEEKQDEEKREQQDVRLVSVLRFFTAFGTFCMTWLGTNPKALDQVVATCVRFVLERTTWRNEKAKRKRPSVMRQLQTFALTLLQNLWIDKLVPLSSLVDFLRLMPSNEAWKEVAWTWLRLVLARHERICNEAQMKVVLEIVAPLVRADWTHEVSSLPLVRTREKNESTTFEVEQQTLAKVVHLVATDDLDVKFRILSLARRQFLQSGVDRIRFTLVPLIYQSLALARDLARQGRDQETEGADKTTFMAVTNPRDVLQYVHEMVTALASKQDALSVSCVHLFLDCALVADGCAYEAVAYEFLSQAIIVYEDHLTLARDQSRALEFILASLRTMQHLSRPHYDLLATKTTHFAARLQKKKEQAAMVLKCAHLFWHPSQQDGKRVRECLQRSLRLADSIKSKQQVPLLLDILEAYMYFFEMGTSEITRKYIVGLLTLVKDHLDNMEYGQMRREGEARYRAIVRHLDALEIADQAISTSSTASS